MVIFRNFYGHGWDDMSHSSEVFFWPPGSLNFHQLSHFWIYTGVWQPEFVFCFPTCGSGVAWSVAIRGCPWHNWDCCWYCNAAAHAIWFLMGINDSSLAIVNSPALNPGGTACLLVRWGFSWVFSAFLGGLMWDFLSLPESLVADSLACGSFPRNILLIDWRTFPWNFRTIQKTLIFQPHLDHRLCVVLLPGPGTCSTRREDPSCWTNLTVDNTWSFIPFYRSPLPLLQWRKESV